MMRVKIYGQFGSLLYSGEGKPEAAFDRFAQSMGWESWRDLAQAKPDKVEGYTYKIARSVKVYPAPNFSQ
jgi:hypothetical protein